jgi:hypothetical protein
VELELLEDELELDDDALELDDEELELAEDWLVLVSLLADETLEEKLLPSIEDGKSEESHPISRSESSRMLT